MSIILDTDAEAEWLNSIRPFMMICETETMQINMQIKLDLLVSTKDSWLKARGLNTQSIDMLTPGQSVIYNTSYGYIINGNNIDVIYRIKTE